jgi:hypothetical protein
MVAFPLEICILLGVLGDVHLSLPAPVNTYPSILNNNAWNKITFSSRSSDSGSESAEIMLSNKICRVLSSSCSISSGLLCVPKKCEPEFGRLGLSALTVAAVEARGDGRSGSEFRCDAVECCSCLINLVTISSERFLVDCFGDDEPGFCRSSRGCRDGVGCCRCEPKYALRRGESTDSGGSFIRHRRGSRAG